MARRDLHSKIFIKNALNISSITTNTTTVGIIIDTAEAPGYESLEFSVKSGVVDTGSYVLKIEDGDDAGLSDAADVISSLLIPSDGTALSGATFTGAADSNKNKRLGVVSHKRYVRPSVVSTSVAGGSTLTIDAILSDAFSQKTPENV